MRARAALAALAVLLGGCRCGARSDAGAPDAGAGDGGADAGDGGFACPAGGPPPYVPVAAPAGATRFALSVYHFNLQYVAGGLEGYPLYEMSEAEVEDAIIVESFAPLLELLGRHPPWGVDLEMQGLMLDVMAARHPAVLAELRALVASGQVELDSAHWSDELVTAWPRADLEKSLDFTGASAAAACVSLGRAAFLQEGQFGEGIADVLFAHGLRALVWPRNLHSFLHAGLAPAPRYTLRGLDLVVSGSVSDAASGVETTWLYANDGELAVTGDLNPYAGPAFLHSDAAVAALEAEYQAAEDAGWAIVTIAAYIDALDAMGVAAEPAPPVLDGTWQPNDTGNLFRWMGGAGISGPTERDNGVLTAVRAARDDVLAARALAAQAVVMEVDEPDDGARVDAAWRELLLAEVSDTTGWNPWQGEVDYGFEHAAAASALALALVDDVKMRLGWPDAYVNTAGGGGSGNGGAIPLEFATLPPPPAPAVAPLSVAVLASLRATTVDWYQDAATGDFFVEIGVGPASAGAGSVEIRFPRGGNTLITTTPAALEDELVSADESAFTFSEIFLPLPAGIIALGPDQCLVADGKTIRLAAGIGPASPDVRFVDDTLPASDSATYRFWVSSCGGAVGRAEEVNVHPHLVR